MADEWKAPEAEPEEREERKSWKLLEKTLLAGVQEQRRARRWGIFFKLLTFVYLFGILALFTPLMDMDKAASRSASHTALVEVRGVIADQSLPVPTISSRACARPSRTARPRLW